MRSAMTCLLLSAALASGCSYPQAAPNNLRLITTLRTALSARNPEWLDQNKALIEERHDSGEMSDEEYDAFQSIISQARSGDWEQAERAAVKFQKAQRPTPEQIERVTKAKT